MNTELDFSCVLSDTQELFKKHWLKLSLWVLVMTIVCTFLSYIPQIIFGIEVMQSPKYEIATYLWSSVTGIIQLGFMLYIYLEVFRMAKGTKSPMSALLVGRFILVSILSVLLIYISLLCCIIPFFFVAPRVMFAPMYIVDNPQMGVGEAIERSWMATQGQVLKLLGFGIIAFLINIIGLMLCCIGVVPAEAFTMVMMVVIYMYLSGQELTADSFAAPYEESFIVE